MFARTSLIAAGLALGLSAFISTPAEAHRRWLLPSMTVFSGESATAAVDAASSNQLFVFEHRGMALDNLTVTGPDGQPLQPKIIGSSDLRSAFDVPLTKQGTYRIAVASSGLMGSYELNGQRQRWRGTKEELANIPAGATNVQVSDNSSRTETFVTLGAPNDTALKPTGRGLEMVPLTPPSDLAAGEPAKVRFLLDGKPVGDLKVEFIEGGTRYRNADDAQDLVTDAKGELTLNAKQAGMYYLEASHAVEGKDGQPGRRASYAAVLEFLPL